MMEYEMRSELGDRKINEDCVGSCELSEGYAAFCLADGLGGHGDGQIASSLAIEALKRVSSVDLSPVDLIHNAFLMAQKAIMEKQRQLNNDMKTTVVLLVIKGGYASWGHIGDSRLYFFQNRKIVERTLDHSVPQMLVNSGEIKEKHIRRHEDRNLLLRVLGVEGKADQYTIDAENRQVFSGDAFLLCSDGFWEWVEEKQMVKTLKKAKSPAEWLSEMSQIARRQSKGNNMDNYSAIAVWILN